MRGMIYEQIDSLGHYFMELPMVAKVPPMRRRVGASVRDKDILATAMGASRATPLF